MLEILKSCIPIVSIFIAIAALILSYQQAKLSNKQHLFDKRVENYLIAMGLMQLYRKNLTIFEWSRKNASYAAVDFIFKLLTNNTYLEQISSVIDDPLKSPHHKEFLIKLENIKDVSTKIELLFSGKASVLLGNFVLNYQEMLLAIYQYQILLVDMRKASLDTKLTIEETKKQFHEEQRRAELDVAFDNLKEAYNLLSKENIEGCIKKQIKLS
ncbi:hypothetical protein LAD12857_31510 [Lacrimispora amygdalina]|uniref:Uncharacterized protein n=1 Tax=Lacrimispora amygdalina TaxID=253257 RepID=A0ABQ5M8H0_9FIRM